MSTTERSIDDFLEKLKQTPRDWITSTSGEIRRWNGTICCCPITSCDPWGPSPCHQYGHAALAMGLNLEQYSSIMHAADNHRAHDPALRARLLEACGLTSN